MPNLCLKKQGKSLFLSNAEEKMNKYKNDKEPIIRMGENKGGKFISLLSLSLYLLSRQFVSLQFILSDRKSSACKQIAVWQWDSKIAIELRVSEIYTASRAFNGTLFCYYCVAEWTEKCCELIKILKLPCNVRKTKAHWRLPCLPDLEHSQSIEAKEKIHGLMKQPVKWFP